MPFSGHHKSDPKGSQANFIISPPIKSKIIDAYLKGTGKDRQKWKKKYSKKK